MLEGLGLSSVIRMGVILVTITFVLSLLPESPFVAYINALDNTAWLRYFNWFFPVSECIATLQAWLGAITVFYTVQVLARLANMID